MKFFTTIFLILCIFSTLLVTLTQGTCQCNQMIHPGVFSGERMTFVAEANHDRETRALNICPRVDNCIASRQHVSNECLHESCFTYHANYHDKKKIATWARSDNDGKQSLNMGAISFEPQYLDFGEQPVGMPSVHHVVVINPSSDKDLQLQAFSGDNTHFYISFSKDISDIQPQSQVLSPLSNTTLDVVFIARTFGSVENTLFIHTLSGAYPYQVRGYGVANPYRLRPYLGARVALDHVFTSVLHMYNPHDSTLQVTEIYSSGGDLHLELPSGQAEAPPEHWQIAPYETKAIIRMNFLGRVVSNHTAFIRIRTIQFNAPTQLLILPVEIEVTTAPGLFPSVDMLDFGTLRKMDEPKSIVVSLLNTHNKPVSLTEIIVEPPNRAIKVHIGNTVIKPAQKYISSFSVTFTAAHLKNLRQNHGKIIVLSTSKGNPRMVLNFQANVLQGTLAYSVSKTRFFIGRAPYQPIVRKMVITNTFTFPLVIYRVVASPDVQDFVSIVNFSSPTTVREQKTTSPFSIRFLADKSMSTLTSSIRVYTNASIFTIPVQCFDGKLQYRFTESVLKLGTLAVKQRNRKTFRIANRNPTSIKLQLRTSNRTLAKLEYLAVGREDINQYSEIPAEGVTLEPNQLLQFCLDVKVPDVDGDYSGNISFITTYETKIMLFSFKAASGHIEVDPVKIVFNNSFPGRNESVPIFLTSSFLNPITVFSSAVKASKPFTFVPAKKSDIQLAPNIREKIGDVVFNPRLACSSDCYLSIGNEKREAWLASLSLPSNTSGIDTLIHQTEWNKWNSLLEARRNSFNRSLYIDTETVKGIEVTMKSGLTWPSLTPDRPIRFPLTHIGNTSHKTLTLENPADVPVVLQVVPLSVYPDAQSAIDVLSDRFDVDLLTAKPSYHSCFSLPTAVLDKYLSDKPDSDVTSSLDATLGVRTSPDAISMIIPPRSKTNIPIQFKPENEDQRTSVIFIRNNLTVLDVVSVQGQGARGELMINGKRPSGDSVLMFELKQKHLEDCAKLNPNSGGKPYRSLTVKKTVLATNPGQLATHVTSFSIDGYECEGYGFKVLNCKALNLKPSASVKIDIAFTPDFSVSRVSRRLQIKTSLGKVFEFSLIATIPSELIPLCAAAAGRPQWEYQAYVSTAFLMIGLLVATLLLAHFEARKVISASLASLPHNHVLLNGTHMNGDIFDLRKISASAQTPLMPDDLYLPRQDGSEQSRTSTKEVAASDKMKGNFYPQPVRSPGDSCERLTSNNNSIISEASEYDRLTVKPNDNDFKKKQKKTTSVNQQTKRKDLDSETPKPIVLVFPNVSTIDTTSIELLNSECPEYETVKSQRDSSSSDGNSVCGEASVSALLAKKDKSKIRKKTAKVSPALLSVDEKKTKVVDKAKAKNSENTKDKEKTDNLEKVKDRKGKQNSETKEDSQEPKKQDAASKPVKLQNNKATSKTSRKTSLPTELEQTHPKPKLDKSKSLPTGSVSKTQSSKSSTANKKNSSNSGKHTQHIEDTPHTITEAINSALEITLKHSPTTETSQSGSRSHSRCSSTSPSPPLSDSSQNLSQSSRSSSYSSVVGSEESVNSDSSSRRKKLSKNQKPSPLVIQKPTGHTNPFSVKRLASSNLVNDLAGTAWKGLRDTTARDLRVSPSLEFPPSSTSSSLFTSTPFDKDGKLERRTSVKDAPEDEDPSSDKHPLYTFHDVKAPGLSTPFVEVGTSVPKFWPDEPIPSLENLIPMKQTRNTNWVNFLDESSAKASKLPSPGMPQSSKTVAEIWDAGHWADENDGWSTAFSPTLEADQVFPPFPGAYDSTSWSTGAYSDYYGIPSEECWIDGNPSSCGTDMKYGNNDNTTFSNGTSSHQLNPYSEPWDGGSSRAKQNVWSSPSNY